MPWTVDQLISSGDYRLVRGGGSLITKCSEKRTFHLMVGAGWREHWRIKVLSQCNFSCNLNAILLLGDVKLANASFHHSLLGFFNVPNICHKFT